MQGFVSIKVAPQQIDVKLWEIVFNFQTLSLKSGDRLFVLTNFIFVSPIFPLLNFCALPFWIPWSHGYAIIPYLRTPAS